MVANELHSDRHSGIHQEHGHLRHIIDSILETVVRRAASCNVIGEMFAELAEHVLDHFRHEETGGYFAEALEHAPRLSERADELLSQHPQMAEQLDEMQKHIASPTANERWWKDLEARFRRFLRGFNKHEAGENELLQQAYFVDIGAED